MTDPARTTKDELLPCPWCGTAPILHEEAWTGHQPVECPNAKCCMSRLWPDVKTWNTRADAADAMRAQVAALQAENDRLTRERDEAWARGDHFAKITMRFTEELVNAGGKSGDSTVQLENLRALTDKANVPLPDVIQSLVYQLWNEHGPTAANALESLARDNAALRTQAEVLERERDDREAMLGDVLEFLDGYVDVVDGDYGQPAPNRAMSLVQQIEQMCPALAEKP